MKPERERNTDSTLGVATATVDLPAAAAFVRHETYELVLITKGDLMDQERKVSLSNIDKWIKNIEIVSEKHSTTYKNIFSRLGNIDESVMVGNSIKSDAVPAVQAGAWGIHVPYPITWELELAEPMSDHERYFEAKSLSNAVDIIRSI